MATITGTSGTSHAPIPDRKLAEWTSEITASGRTRRR